MGRKPLPAAERRSQIVTVRATTEERKRWEAAAKREALPFSEWTRIWLERAASRGAKTSK